MEKSELCPDCGVREGERHDDGCDVTRCKWSGLQMLSCGYFHDAVHPQEHEPCTWTGYWPGETFAAAQGWFYGPDLPDLNKVYSEMTLQRVVWDPETEDFRLSEGVTSA